ncbi:MAG TPA: proline dehydrogenase family protein [Acidobacteriaceae bacterium]|jgi:proline dehydrogenase
MLRSFFISLSTNKSFRRFSERSSLGRQVSRRFVAGMTVEEAIAAATQLNREGIAVTLDSLGESVTDAEHAEASAAIYHRLLDEIAAHNLRANVSLKLTQMGMDVGGANSPEGQALTQRIVGTLVEHAAHSQNFVRIDMEGSEYTEATLAMTERLNALHRGAVGTVLQAYLFRTEADAERLLQQGIRIRLCKGAYKEPPEVAFPAKSDVDANYLKLAKRMIPSGVFCGIATHDEAIIDELCRFVRAHSIEKSAFEFQMLYGIRRDLQRKLVSQGYGVRVYVPFGAEWYPYFMRRLAERPANVLFLARNFFRS